MGAARRGAATLLSPLAVLALLAPAAAAQDAVDDVLAEMRAHIEELNQRVTELTQRTLTLEEQLAAARAGGANAPDEFYIPRLATEFEESGLPASMGGVYTKPYLSQLGERTYLGGYIDLEFVDPRGDDDKFFDQHRFVPFIYADVSDRVKVSSELEFEHGHEVGVEFAQIDYLFTDAFNVRAGIQLLPLGKLNEVHDSPIQDLTERPLVDRFIIPTTLRDAGVGFWGALSEVVSYQATITNGFRGLDAAGNNVITAEDGLREAAPHQDGLGDPFDQLNDDLAYAGRVAVKPVLGVELGASALRDTYDENGDNDLGITAIDATVDGKSVGFLPDALELQGEAAWADVERDAFAEASGVAGDMDGYYVQANYHFDPAWLASWKQGGAVDETAHFTFVTRYDHVNLDTYDRRRTTLGLNFRPNAQDTVFKLDYQFNDDSGSLQGSNDDDALLFSIATYF